MKEPKSNIFENIFKDSEHKQSSNDTGNLFGNISTNGRLFGSNNNLLFGNDNNNIKLSENSLFGNNNSNKILLKKNNGNNNILFGEFINDNTIFGKSLFDNSLFNNKNNGSLFGNNNINSNNNIFENINNKSITKIKEEEEFKENENLSSVEVKEKKENKKNEKGLFDKTSKDNIFKGISSNIKELNNTNDTVKIIQADLINNNGVREKDKKENGTHEAIEQKKDVKEDHYNYLSNENIQFGFKDIKEQNDDNPPKRNIEKNLIKSEVNQKLDIKNDNKVKDVQELLDEKIKFRIINEEKDKNEREQQKEKDKNQFKSEIIEKNNKYKNEMKLDNNNKIHFIYNNIEEINANAEKNKKK